MLRAIFLAAGFAAAVPTWAAASGAEQMVRAIVETCVTKVANAVPIQADWLEPASAGSYRSADGSVLVLDTDADFACQVVGSVEPAPVSQGLNAWANTTDYAFVGQVPMSRNNLRGLYIYGVAAAGGYVQIHVTNLPDGRVGALVTRAETNGEARAVLGR